MTVSVLAAEKDDALCCVVVEKAGGKSMDEDCDAYTGDK